MLRHSRLLAAVASFYLGWNMQVSCALRSARISERGNYDEILDNIKLIPLSQHETLCEITRAQPDPS